MNRFTKMVFIEWKLNNRNFMNLFFSLAFPMMMLLLFGSMYGNEPDDFFGGFGMVDVSVPGYLCMIIAVAGLMTLPLTLAQYRERKILKRFMVTPVKPLDLLMSQLIVNAITTFLGTILLLLVGKIVFKTHFYGRIIPTLAAYLLIILSIFVIGLFIAGIAKNAKMATAISYIIYFPMLFLSGATMPLEAMPTGVANISKILPLTYGVRLLKGVWLGGKFFDYANEIIVLLLMVVVLGLLSLKFFKWE
ncbi:MAG: ABC transporter permease [Clostridia bacterium]|nr:ABC transporter permease [Clostridia bacterium]